MEIVLLRRQPVQWIAGHGRYKLKLLDVGRGGAVGDTKRVKVWPKRGERKKRMNLEKVCMLSSSYCKSTGSDVE